MPQVSGALGSVYRDQRCPDLAAFTEQDVVGANRRPCWRDLEPDPRIAKAPAQLFRHEPRLLASPEHEQLDARAEYPCERLFGDLLGLGYGPCPDAGREAQDGAAMRHVGEAEAALAVSLDRGGLGEVALVQAHLRMILSENRCPVFEIMRLRVAGGEA